MAVKDSHSAIRISPRGAAIDCLLRIFGNNEAPLMAQRLKGSHPIPQNAEDLPHGGRPRKHRGRGGLKAGQARPETRPVHWRGAGGLFIDFSQAANKNASFPV